MSRELAVKAIKNQKDGSYQVFRVDNQNGKQKEILISRKPALREYVTGLQVYNSNVNGNQYQDYFEKDMYDQNQNDKIKNAERTPQVQREYNILKDIKMNDMIKKVIYKNIGDSFKNGSNKKNFPLLDFFTSISSEEEIRSCYMSVTSDAPLSNPLGFKDLDILKHERIDWLKRKRMISL